MVLPPFPRRSNQDTWRPQDHEIGARSCCLHTPPRALREAVLPVTSNGVLISCTSRTHTEMVSQRQSKCSNGKLREAANSMQHEWIGWSRVATVALDQFHRCPRGRLRPEGSYCARTALVPYRIGLLHAHSSTHLYVHVYIR